jgi:hypothetical protein
LQSSGKLRFISEEFTRAHAHQLLEGEKLAAYERGMTKQVGASNPHFNHFLPCLYYQILTRYCCI